jgi:hypothetical protein
MGRPLCFAIIALLPAIACATTGGPTYTDTFDGIVKDTARWEERSLDGASITQNGNLTFVGTQSDSPEYTTRQIKIPVGGFARADIRVHDFAPNFTSGFLRLSTNTTGTAQVDFFDSYKINFQYYNGFALTGYGDANSDTGQSTAVGFPADTFATLEIERATASLANYRIYDPVGGGVVFFRSAAVPTFTGDLYITIDGGSSGGVVTWDNVTVPLSSVPEPGVVGMLTSLAMPMLRRRRQFHRSIL